MTQHPESPLAEDLAMLTMRFFRRCLDELELPPALAERMAGDFYAQMSQAVIQNLWNEPDSDTAIIALLGGGRRS